ncbi:MAG: ABC transporter permease [Enterocloster asparagiformis]|nr:ABC transporter permease [Enterocloster asparagiformis]
MGRYIAKRLLYMIPVIFGVALLVFTIMYFVPGDPAAVILGGSATQTELDALRENMGLNQPFLVQLATYLKKLFLHFDFGNSYITSLSISRELLSRFPRTFVIALSCMVLSILIGIPLGVNAAVHQNGFGDRISMFVALFGVSMPGFWIGLLLVLLFSLRLGWLPPSGIGGFKFYILPCIANSMGGIATLARQTRSSMLEVIRSDYIVTARSKGLNERNVIYRHALPNALIPVITVVGQSFGRMLGGTLVIETVFSIPGIGAYMITGVNNRDYAAVEGSIIFVAVMFSIVMLLVDLVYALVDPRIKAQYVGTRRRKVNG